jgi:hypothetical protein
LNSQAKESFAIVVLVKDAACVACRFSGGNRVSLATLVNLQNLGFCGDPTNSLLKNSKHFAFKIFSIGKIMSL